VVPGAVNAEPIGLYKDHLGLVKFESKNDPDYMTIRQTIELMIRKLPQEEEVGLC
jgi:hypothetical protein